MHAVSFHSLLHEAGEAVHVPLLVQQLHGGRRGDRAGIQQVFVAGPAQTLVSHRYY